MKSSRWSQMNILVAIIYLSRKVKYYIIKTVTNNHKIVANLKIIMSVFATSWCIRYGLTPTIYFAGSSRFSKWLYSQKWTIKFYNISSITSKVSWTSRLENYYKNKTIIKTSNKLWDCQKYEHISNSLFMKSSIYIYKNKINISKILWYLPKIVRKKIWYSFHLILSGSLQPCKWVFTPFQSFSMKVFIDMIFSCNFWKITF